LIWQRTERNTGGQQPPFEINVMKISMMLHTHNKYNNR
jgi:hypothetical protein